MFDFGAEMLKTAIADIGLREIAGPKDHPKIILAHRITRVISMMEDTSADVDAIPWCSSMLNLWYLQTCLRINPARVVAWLVKKKLPSEVIVAVCELEKLNIARIPPDNGIDLREPTWSAGASSWQSWGVPVPSGEEKPGDMACFTREGGNHIALFLRKGYIFVTVLGANQSNKVCEADTYSRTRFVGARRYA